MEIEPSGRRASLPAGSTTRAKSACAHWAAGGAGSGTVQEKKVPTGAAQDWPRASAGSSSRTASPSTTSVTAKRTVASPPGPSALTESTTAPAGTAKEVERVSGARAGAVKSSWMAYVFSKREGRPASLTLSTISVREPSGSTSPTV